MDDLSMSMFASREDYERARFEAWWAEHHATPAYPNEDGTYTRSTVSLAWAAWQERERLRAQGKYAEIYERDGVWFLDDLPPGPLRAIKALSDPALFGGYCIAGSRCRCKGLEIEQRQGCEEWTNASL